MAIFCLATDLNDLKRRLANIIVAQTRAREPVRAGAPPEPAELFDSVYAD
jgi:formyltetrahydrofolate synthetase